MISVPVNPMIAVSIHASVKDATSKLITEINDINVSIHASVKDATDWCAENVVYGSVSIHASVKDATSVGARPAYALDCFNPRICKRCDI